MVVGTATKGESPFKELVTHGFVLDAEGKKMSKSVGNVIAPKQVIKNVGADVLRLLCLVARTTSRTCGSARRCSRASPTPTGASGTRSGSCSATCRDFDPAKDAVDYAEMEELDRFALHRLQELIEQVTRGV